MAAEPFNSISGYTIGIPPVAVIDANGNVISNFLNLSGNVTANKVYANSYFYANGQPFVSVPAGNNTQLQFNNNGAFGGVPNVTWNGNTLNLGDVTTLRIGGGENGYFLQTDGNGNLTWTQGGGGGGGNGTPGGANTQIQFNDGGNFGGDSGFTYNKVTNTLTVENISAGDSLNDTVNITGNLSVNGNINLSTNFVSEGNITGANITGNRVTGNLFIGNGSLLTNVVADLASFVTQPIQSNITSVGNLVTLSVVGVTNTTGNITTTGNFVASGNANIGGNIAIVGNISATNLSLSANVNASNGTFTNRVTVGSNLTVNSAATLRLEGNFNVVNSPNINLGSISNLHISGGVNGYILSTDGAGNLSWVPDSGSGNGNPGGMNTQVQYNSTNSFAGSPNFTFNDVTNTLQVSGNLIANSIQLGSGVYRWSTTKVYFANTNTNNPNQLLFSIPVADLSGVEFDIIATDPTWPSRQFCKISSMYFDEAVQYNEYATLIFGNKIGSFVVDYNPGNIVTPASLELKVSPSTASTISYKMLITVFAN